MSKNYTNITVESEVRAIADAFKKDFGFENMSETLRFALTLARQIKQKEKHQ